MSDPTKPTVADKPGAIERDEREANDGLVTKDERPGDGARSVPKPPSVGERYETGEEIARGGMGRVALATDRRLDRVVAVKQALTEDPETLRRFARETKITARLEHPSIIPVYDAGEQDGSPFYVMRRVSGRPLDDLIDDAPTLAERLAILPHVLAAAQAVAHAHRRGIVHRDIKPSNILIGELGETVVIDWGLAKVVGEPDDDDPVEPSAGDSLRTRAGTVFGTPGFMSRSQLRGEPVGPSTDVYALGATLYFVLSGRPPHHAKTGDAMMALAAKGPPTPIAELVPGVPRELSTIIDTALAFGESSYPDAAAFAEDLRRFSTGQLVASHRYSAGERVRRFVRRHRAAVAIAVAAIVVVAVVGTVAIRSVIEESNHAARAAEQAREAQANEADRADQMLVLRARMLVDTAPTEAIAVLKDLAPSSRHVPDAHTIASAATMRGVAWAMPGRAAFSVIAALDGKGERLVQVTLSNDLVVTDLERRRTVYTKRLDSITRVLWVGDRLLLHGDRVATALLDPATGATEALAFPRFFDVQVSGNGKMLVGLTVARELVMLDLAARTATPLWPGHKVKELTLPDDGSWIGASDDTEAVALARDGTVMVSRTGKIDVIAASRSSHLAVLDDSKLFQIEVTKPDTWRQVDLSTVYLRVLRFFYRGENLLVVTASGHFLILLGSQLIEVDRPQGGVMFSYALGEHEVVLLGGAHELHYFDSTGTKVLALPHTLTKPRLAAVRNRRRVVVTAIEGIFVWDLEAATPVRLDLPSSPSARFIDEDTLLIGSTDHSLLAWYPLPAGPALPIDHHFIGGIVRPVDQHVATGRVLLSIYGGDTSALVVLTKGRRDHAVVHQGPGLSAARLTRTGVLFGAGKKIYVVDGGSPRELVDVGGPIDSLALLDDTRFAALSATGLLVRGSLAGGAVERVQLPPATRMSQRLYFDARPDPLEPDQQGRPLVAWGTSVFRWSDRVEQLARFESNVISVGILGDQIYVTTGTGSALIHPVTLAVVSAPTHAEPSIDHSDHSIVLFEVFNKFHVLDSSGRSWATPIPKLPGSPSLSPSGRRVVARGNSAFLMWTIPHATGALRDRLDRLTNAIESKDGRMIWPWQR